MSNKIFDREVWNKLEEGISADNNRAESYLDRVVREVLDQMTRTRTLPLFPRCSSAMRGWPVCFGFRNSSMRKCRSSCCFFVRRAGRLTRCGMGTFSLQYVRMWPYLLTFSNTDLAACSVFLPSRRARTTNG